MPFPSEWPEGCPPTDAQPASGEVFRVVKVDPPTADDFLTFQELGKPDSGKPCEAAGVSVFRDAKDARHYCAKFPHLGELIAKGSLSSSHGAIKSTPRNVGGKPNSHATWWPCTSIIRHSLFSIA